MELVFLDVLRAIWALRRDPGFVVLAVTALVLILGGAAFFWMWEDLSVVNAAYLSVMTLTTIGYGDVKPVTAAGKIFSIFFVIMGIGVLLALLTSIASQLRRQSLLHRPLARLTAHREGNTEVDTLEVSPNGGYDVLVIGVDDASRETALQAAKLGLRVVMVEEGHIQAGPRTGGTRR